MVHLNKNNLINGIKIPVQGRRVNGATNFAKKEIIKKNELYFVEIEIAVTHKISTIIKPDEKEKS